MNEPSSRITREKPEDCATISGAFDPCDVVGALDPAVTWPLLSEHADGEGALQDPTDTRSSALLVQLSEALTEVRPAIHRRRRRSSCARFG
jgi:hypothetical protein